MLSSDLPAAVEENLLGLLLKCKQTKDLTQLKRLHARIRERDLESHPLLGNSLIHALLECGCLQDAQLTFDRISLQFREVGSWTALISAYVDHDDTAHAFQLYNNMLTEPHSIQPNHVTYLAMLKACSYSTDVYTGRCLHSEIVRRGLDVYVSVEGCAIVCNTLVDMYGKCGFLTEARRVFETSPVQDVVSWTVLITGYAEHGHSEEARACLQQMQLDGIPPSSVTFLGSMKACISGKALDSGRELHDAIVKRGWESELYVGSALVDMYTKCGSPTEAHIIFNKLPQRNAISWAALIAGYAEHDMSEKAVDCVQQMQLEGVTPDPVLFVCSLKSCGTVRALETGQRIHAEVTKHGLERDLLLCSSILDMYGKCGSHLESRYVFNTLLEHDIVSWNSLISGYIDCGLVQDARSCLHEMEAEGVFPGTVTFLCNLKVCSIIGMSKQGQEAHMEVIRRGLESEQSIGNTLVDMYIKCGLLLDAQQTFDRLHMQDKVSWNALLSGYAEHGHDEEALECFKKMQLAGISTDPVTYIGCLKASGSVSALDVGHEVHAKIRKAGLEGDPFVASTLVAMYGKCGAVLEARKAFDKLPVPGCVPWTALIKAYGENHDVIMAIQSFEDMCEQEVKPDSLTFLCLLAACSHANLVGKGQDYFRLMREYGIIPTMDHYACMVDLLARCGRVYEAERFVVGMQCPPSGAIFMALLSACKVYSKEKLGEQCFEQLVELKQEAASAYSFMGRHAFRSWEVEPCYQSS